MNILVVTHYFWPENLKINDVAKGLLDKGHNVSVLTGLPNYPKGKFYKGYSFPRNKKENYEGITIYRSPVIPRGNGSSIRLFLNYLSLALSASLRVLFIKDKFDKILVYEASPVTIGIPAIIAKFRFNAPIFFWVQDLWPESITAAGGVKNKYVINLVDNLTRFIYWQSEKILVQSRAFIPYILNQKVNKNKLIYLPNSTEKFYKKVDPNNRYKKIMPKDGPILMFAGNIGEAQGFNTIIKSASYLNDSGVKVNWVILGDGRQRELIEREITDLGLQKNFFFLGSYPSEEMPYFFVHADAMLVTLKKNLIFSMTIPNKIQSYMACSKPIIANLDGEGGRVILEAECGLVSPSEDFMSFSKSIITFLKLSSNKKEVMGNKARLYFETEFEREKQLNKIINIFNN
ncbi:glycosyltransferase family 4 protein [Aurantibacter sp.]|uniref:glycosyltransferase family 4 protein n=1 Tax=Aurantibacter sp. TaxID=2807103 RepID=UPI0035C7B100